MKHCIFILTLLFANSLYAATILNGRCIEVLDGDTYKAEITIKGKKEVITVRCNGIDAPEKGQFYGDEAREFLTQLILNRPVIMQFEKKDVYNRYLCKTVVKTPCGNIMIEKAMLDAGCAWHFVRYSDNATFQSIEDSARSRKVGIWAQTKPQPPWEFRQQRKGGYANENLIDDEPAPTKNDNHKPTPKSNNKKPPVDGGITDGIFNPSPSKRIDSTQGLQSGQPAYRPFPTYSNVETKKEVKYWYNTETGVYHRKGCQYFGCPQGIPVDKPRGRPCQKCGG